VGVDERAREFGYNKSDSLDSSIHCKIDQIPNMRTHESTTLFYAHENVNRFNLDNNAWKSSMPKDFRNPRVLSNSVLL